MKCDVCNQELTRSGNTKLLYCPMQVRWVEKLRRNLEYHHIFVSIDNNYNIISKIITAPPYIFELDFKNKCTKIKKITSFKIKTLLNTPVKLDESHEEKDIIEINHILDMPWNDIEKLEEKVKIYNLFS